MPRLSCADILAGRAPADTPITLNGWVRTRRDSKAGLSFVHVSDGSGFHPVQVVAPQALAELRERGVAPHRRLRSGSHGQDRAIAREGPAVRDAGGHGARRRLGRRSGHVPDPAQAAHARVPARGRAPAPAHQRHRRVDARAPHGRQGHSRVLRPAGLPVGQHADHHGLGCGRRRCAVSRVHARSRQPAAHARRQGRLRAGLLRPRGVPHRVGSAQRRGVLPRAVEGVHVRPHVPRGELEHEPASRRVLDDRARDRVRAARRRRRSRRGVAEARLQDGARGACRRHGVLRGAHREGRRREAHGHRRARVRAHGLHGGDPHPRDVEAQVRVPGVVGHRPADRSTSAISPRSTSAGR